VYIGFGYDLDKRNSATVMVDEGRAFAVMYKLPGIFLDVNSGDAYSLAAGVAFYIYVSVLAYRGEILRDLISFWKIGIEIIFSVDARYS
jgi:hypothetical protein